MRRPRGEGFEKFLYIIVVSKNKFGCTEIMAGYESTGPYAEPLAQYPMDKPVAMVQVNPLHAKRLKEVNDNSPLKNDDKDPRVIADVLRLGHALSVVVPGGESKPTSTLSDAL
jgi:transposase